MTAAFLNAEILATLTDGQWHNTPPERFSHISIDNRNLTSGGLFTALAGEHHDGHVFVSELDSARGQAAIVSTLQTGDVAQLLTPAPLTALQQIAQYCAEQTGALKIAITGSVGKTGTKEMVAHILARHGAIHASSRNYNNHIGLPLTLANIPASCNFAIVEMGMNHAGEISLLSDITKPQIAAITCIADSHLGHFENIDGIASAKSEIFDHLNKQAIAILPKDDRFYDFLAETARTKGADRIISFGTDASADICMTDCIATDAGLAISIRYLDAEANEKTLRYTLGMHAPHWAINSLCALAICHAAGIAPEIASACLADMQDLPGRGKRYRLALPSGSAVMIDDSYNAGPESMRAALVDFASSSASQKTLILSDMLELGAASQSAHEHLIPLIHKIQPSLLLAIGTEMSQIANYISGQISGQTSRQITCITAPEISAILDNKAEYSRFISMAGGDILVKGSHGSGAYRLAELLRKTYGTQDNEAIGDADVS